MARRWSAPGFPVIGLSARRGSDYTAELPGGATVRRNPVNTPSGCRGNALERIRTK
ncbi:hypothetical protein ACTMTI_08800 [Nonomuraea sp. H19]|uniref:hypothetical protein n=1 Tax=Nonomuraea sp. H19 TaxID=3452206 RepID=UPI003F894FD6